MDSSPKSNMSLLKPRMKFLQKNSSTEISTNSSFPSEFSSNSSELF